MTGDQVGNIMILFLITFYIAEWIVERINDKNGTSRTT